MFHYLPSSHLSGQYLQLIQPTNTECKKKRLRFDLMIITLLVLLVCLQKLFEGLRKSFMLHIQDQTLHSQRLYLQLQKP